MIDDDDVGPCGWCGGELYAGDCGWTCEECGSVLDDEDDF